MTNLDSMQDVPILVVEDNKVYRAYLIGILQDYTFCGLRFSVQTVDSLAGAVTWLRASAPALVILDLFLPDSSSISTLDAVLGWTRSAVPVLVLTAMEDWTLAAEMIKRGAEDVIMKNSISAQQLTWRIWRTVQRGSTRTDGGTGADN